MKTEFNIGDFVWATFKVNEINVSSSGAILYNLIEVSDHCKGIHLINKREEELVPANFKEEYDIESCAHKIKCYRIVENYEPGTQLLEENRKYGWYKRPGIYEVENGNPSAGYIFEEPVRLTR